MLPLIITKSQIWRRLMRKITFALLLCMLPVLCQAQVNPWKGRYVIAVPDGDTLVLDNGEVARLIGLLSPPSDHGKNRGSAFGNEARLITEEMLLGQPIDISFDPAYGPAGHRDKFGRALVYVNVSRGPGKVIANEELLRSGVGFFYDDGHSLEIGSLLKSAEEEARKKRIGIWATTEKSPLEMALASGSAYQEPAPSVNLTYIRPISPILEGPNVPHDVVASNHSTPVKKGPKASLDMADLKETKLPAYKSKTPEPVVVKERKVFASSFDAQKQIEFYSTVLSNNQSDYRVSIKEKGQEVTFVTDYQGIKDLSSLMSKGTESQPVLTSVENNVGSLHGEEGTITITTGKDGGINLQLSGIGGSNKIFLTRFNALSLQTKIANMK